MVSHLIIITNSRYFRCKGGYSALTANIIMKINVKSAIRSAFFIKSFIITTSFRAIDLACSHTARSVNKYRWLTVRLYIVFDSAFNIGKLRHKEYNIKKHKIQ